jgi:REP element-mobilizing transposase RayT
MRRLKVSGRDAVHHVMTRTVNGESLFKDRKKKTLQKVIRQVSDFCGVDVLTYCIMSNHFHGYHGLLRVPDGGAASDPELMRLYKVLYPQFTKYLQASADTMVAQLKAVGEDAEAICHKLLVRMFDVSEFMKAVKNHPHRNSYHVIFFGALGAQLAFLFNFLKNRNARNTNDSFFVPFKIQPANIGLYYF